MPMAMASPPRDIRFEEIPKSRIMMKAKKIENGIERATTRLARSPPMKISSTPVTSSTPASSASVTVRTHRETRRDWS